MENWKLIDGYNNYEVSDFGRVRNLNGKILNVRVCCGYNRVRLYSGGIGKNKLVHRLVAESFISKDDNKIFINHKDGNKLNNVKCNLEWVNHSENQIHRYNVLKIGLKPVSLIKDGVIYNFESIIDASKNLNIDSGNLSRLVNGIYKKCKGYTICQ